MAPFMDREKVTKPTAQIGFIKFVLLPMFETIAKASVSPGRSVLSNQLIQIYENDMRACAPRRIKPVGGHAVQLCSLLVKSYKGFRIKN